MRLDNGYVLIRVETGSRTTKSGIVLNFNPDKLYAADVHDTSSHPADVARVHGIVEALPRKLLFDPTSENSMDWETEIELRVGDEVWFDYMDAVKTDEAHRIIPYGSIYTAKRKRIIPINGYCLFTIPEPPEPWMKIDHSIGIVYAVGKKNKRYLYDEWHDDIDIEVGDKVRFSEKKANYPVFLERLEALAEFQERVVRAQRKDILMVL